MSIARVLLTSGELKVSKEGFDVTTATADQLLLGAGVYPQAIIEAGKVIAPQQVTFGLELPYIPLIAFQASFTTTQTIVVPYSNYGSAETYVAAVPSRIGITFGTSGGNRLVNYVVFRSQTA